MFKRKLSSFFIVIIFLITGLFLIVQTTRIHNIVNIKIVKIAGINIFVDLATTDDTRTLGLSGRQSLKSDVGMLFVFDYDDKYHFWMKDMKFSIDMIWIGSDKRIVYIKKNVLPESYPATYGPGPDDRDAKYVLEVVSGFSGKNNLQIGDSVEFIY